jgi:MFS family permease
MIGYLFAFSGMVIVGFQLIINKVLRKYGAVKTLVMSSIVSILGYLLTAFSRTVDQLFLSMGVITLAEIFFVVPSQLWITMNSPSSRKGAYQGYYSAVRNGGHSVAAWMGSTTLGIFVFNPVYAWLIIVGCAVAYGLGYVVQQKLSEKRG